MNKYDVGLVGYWYATNYGSVITYYALGLAINKMGYSTVLIDHPDRDDSMKHVFSYDFFKNRCNMSESVDWDKIDSLNDLCSSFVVGSDQVWTTTAIKDLRYTFFLSFADDDKKRIAYATSFGNIDRFKLDGEQEDIVKNYLRKFDKISIREVSGAKMVRERFGIKADRTLDPVFLITKKDYDSIANESNINTDGKYVLAYILDPTPDKENFIKKVSEKMGLKVKIILDGRKGTFQKNKEIFKLFGDESIIPNVKEEDWVKLFRDSEYVLTDSHHGLAMAVIYNKNYICYANRSRGYERFTSLLTLLNMMDRMVDNNGQVTEKLINTPVNYSAVNEKLASEKERSLKWLKEGIETPKEELPNIILPENVACERYISNCTGCGACVGICPVNAVELKPDDLGYYRSSVDNSKCVNCGKCVKTCPAVKLPKNTNSTDPELYEFVVKDKNVLFNSSSGGAFPMLAEEVFKRNGAIFGAAWSDDFSVEHIMIDNPADLHKLQKSKYLQSYMGDTFRKVKEKLEQSVFVLFTGCPCQVAGLKSFLGKEYNNLIAVDLLCGNAPSTMFFKKYVEETFPDGLQKYEFRHKVKGWKADCTTTTTTNGVVSVTHGGKEDNYQRVYHTHTMCAPHCENCKYQSVPRFGDITIGDFWGITKKDPSIDAKYGVSAVLCNNQKGKDFFDGIPSNAASVKKKVPLSWLGGNGYAINGGHNHCSPNRDDFYKAIRTMTFTEAVKYAVKPNHGIKETLGLFDYRPRSVHFSFDPVVWCENYINGAVVLSTKTLAPPVGNYAVLPISAEIKEGKKYTFKARFKISTDSSIFNFHIKSSGEKFYQVIYSHMVSPNDSTKWVEISNDFIADSDIYDEFMLGAAQLKGDNRWLAIDYIGIYET